MGVPGTTRQSALAAAARRAAARSGPVRTPVLPRRRKHVADLCPLCSADLGGQFGATRRLSFLDGRPGLLWGCPECGGRWRADAGAV